MANKKKKSIKIQVTDYEACWKEYLSLVYQIALQAKMSGNTKVAEKLKPLFVTLRNIEQKHTKDEIVQ